MSQIFGNVDRSEHVARFKTRACARGTAAKRDALQRHQQRLALHASKRQIHAAGIPGHGIAVSHDLRQIRHYLLDQTIRQCGDISVIVLNRQQCNDLES